MPWQPPGQVAADLDGDAGAATESGNGRRRPVVLEQRRCGGDRLVVDASVAVGILLREPGSEAVQGRLAGAAGGELLVPEHFWLEITNVLVRRYACKPNDVVAALRELDEMQLVTVALDRPAILHGLELMARHGLTAYDAAYLALAEVTDAELLTAATAGSHEAPGADAGDLSRGRRGWRGRRLDRMHAVASGDPERVRRAVGAPNIAGSGRSRRDALRVTNAASMQMESHRPRPVGSRLGRARTSTARATS